MSASVIRAVALDYGGYVATFALSQLDRIPEPGPARRLCTCPHGVTSRAQVRDRRQA